MASLAYRRENLDKAPPEKLYEIYAWLTGFRVGFIGQYLKARSMQPEHIWERHQMFGIENLAEQRILNAARRAMIEEWKRRPALLKREKINEPEPKNKSARAGSKKSKRNHQRQR